MSDTVSGILIILIGLLAIIGAALNWRIVTHPRKLLNLLLGDTIAKTIYIAVGFILLVLGIGRVLGLGWLGK
jgi:hypothetical protein